MRSSRFTAPLIAVLFAFFAAGELQAFEARLIGPGNQCLGTSGTPATRSRLVLGNCGSASDSSQRFTMPSRGFAGEVRLGGLCLDVDRSLTTDGNPIQVFPCHGGANQRWQHDTLGRLVGLAGKCLDLTAGGGGAGGPAALFPCGTSSAQTFLAEPFEAWGPTHALDSSNITRLLSTSDAAIAYRQAGEALLRSNDGGRTWATVNYANDYIWNLVVDPTQPNRLWRSSGRKLSRSDDGGRSWRVLTVAEEGLIFLSASRRNPGVLVALSETGVWLSRDYGLTLARRADLPAIAVYEQRSGLSLVENGQGHWVLTEGRYCYTGSAGCTSSDYIAATYTTTDFGLSWQKTFAFNANDRLVLASSPAAPQTLFGLESDGEVLRSQDGGHNFTRVGRLPGSDSLGSYLTGIAGDPAGPSKIWAIYSNRIYASTDGGGQWLEMAGSLLTSADLRAQAVSVLSDGTVLVLAQRARPDIQEVVISRDGGANWAIETPGFFSNGRLVAAAQPGRYYSYSQGMLLRTDDRGRFWQEIWPRPCVRALATDPVEPATFYASSARCSYLGQEGEFPRGLWRSRDAGATYENITPPGVNHNLDPLVALRHGNTTVLLAAESFNNGGRLWRSSDGGNSWQSVAAATSTLYGIVADAGKIWVTAEGSALHQSSDGGQTWAPFSGGPSVFEVGGGKKAYWANGNIVVELASGALVTSPNPGLGLYILLDRYGRLYLTDLTARTIFRSLDDGRTWQNLEAGSLGHSLYGFWDADPFDPELLLAKSESGPMIGRFADPAVLSLGHGRFKATIDWKAPDGLAGRGYGKNLTNDSGGFWFFSPERTEVVVKVLDGRQINGRFWVFVGSLTDVEFDLEVMDQVSGEKRRYRNNASSFASFGDTQAFPLGEAQRTIEGTAPNFYYSSTTRAVPVGAHFEVEVDWQTATGQGVGKGSQLSGETAAFTFFSPENVELLVNVIDGRAINGRYWVFAASLSNVAYTLRVRDLQTGEVKEYQNPAGSFASFGDTSAF